MPVVFFNTFQERREVRVAERDVTKIENMEKYKDEIMARPKRSWFQSEKEKKKVEDARKELLEAKKVAPTPATQSMERGCAR